MVADYPPVRGAKLVATRDVEPVGRADPVFDPGESHGIAEFLATCSGRACG
jgi:hypothetical protein